MRPLLCLLSLYFCTSSAAFSQTMEDCNAALNNSLILANICGNHAQFNGQNHCSKSVSLINYHQQKLQCLVDNITFASHMKNYDLLGDSQQRESLYSAQELVLPIMPLETLYTIQVNQQDVDQLLGRMTSIQRFSGDINVDAFLRTLHGLSTEPVFDWPYNIDFSVFTYQLHTRFPLLRVLLPELPLLSVKKAIYCQHMMVFLVCPYEPPRRTAMVYFLMLLHAVLYPVRQCAS